MGVKKIDKKATPKEKPAEPRLQVWVPIIVAIITLLGAVINSPNFSKIFKPNSLVPSEQNTSQPEPTTTVSALSTPCLEGMVYVKEGDFIFGALETDGNARQNEKPFHNIYLDAFCIDRTEVSNSAYAKFAKSLGITWDEDDLPAVNLTWKEARTYCKSLELDLPTEYQWEKAARGADGRIYPWGREEDLDNANIENLEHSLRSVFDFKEGASPYGALNMAGNAAEWTKDWYDSDWYASIPDFGKNPSGPLEPGESGTMVVRGGSFGEIWQNARTTARLGTIKPDEKRYFIGFRCISSP